MSKTRRRRRGRVELLDTVPAMLMVHARKIGPVPDVIRVPQQSDYVAAWSSSAKSDGRLKALLRARLRISAAVPSLQPFGTHAT
jgi:hypothetical protein